MELEQTVRALQLEVESMKELLHHIMARLNGTDSPPYVPSPPPSNEDMQEFEKQLDILEADSSSVDTAPQDEEGLAVAMHIEKSLHNTCGDAADDDAKAEEDAAEATQIKAEEDAVAVAARIKAEEAAQIKAEEEAAEAARIKAEEEAAEAARIKAEEEAAEAARIKAEEEAAEAARMKAEEDAAREAASQLASERKSILDAIIENNVRLKCNTSFALRPQQGSASAALQCTIVGKEGHVSESSAVTMWLKDNIGVEFSSGCRVKKLEDGGYELSHAGQFIGVLHDEAFHWDTIPVMQCPFSLKNGAQGLWVETSPTLCACVQCEWSEVESSGVAWNTEVAPKLRAAFATDIACSEAVTDA